uniref:Uncharacterized protein n=1 Tax=Physcomitrium patens TaxID=3218 RepID=A0A2K1IR79_PHYPA|nr:hypothetical protein PHYPA_025905 [Physcomitrium patens]
MAAWNARQVLFCFAVALVCNSEAGRGHPPVLAALSYLLDIA